MSEQRIPQADAGLIYQFGPFKLDVQKKTLHCGETRVPLRPKMYALLLLLLSRAGQTVTKDEIADSLWPGGYVLEGNITQQIFFLREALRAAGDDQDYIVTNPGMGYTFVAAVGKFRKSNRLLAHPEAYVEYVKGLGYAEKRTEQHYVAAARHFRTAIALSPGFTAAHAALANVLSRLATLDALYPHDAFPEARDAALAALRFDPQATDALVALGQVAQFYDRNERSARGFLMQAVESNPQSVSARIFLSWHFFFFGHLEQAHEQLDYVFAAEPDAPRAHFSLAMASLFEENVELAVAMLRTLKDMSPSFYLPQFYLGTILAETGSPGEALQILTDLPDSFLPRFTQAAVAHAHAAAGNATEARRILQELERLSQTAYVSHYYLARAYCALRDEGMLRSALIKADKQADPWLIFLRAHPFWKRYRNDRFIVRLLQPRISSVKGRT